MTKFKLIIAPSSNDEEAFEQAGNFDEALKVITEQDIESAQEFSFNTEQEREIFIQGYKAAIGYNGDGLFWTKDDDDKKLSFERDVEREAAYEQSIKEGMLFARKCDATGEGMNEGWVFNDGDAYFKYEQDALKYAQSLGCTDLDEAFYDEVGYYTEWDAELDAQYVIERGELVGIEY